MHSDELDGDTEAQNLTSTLYRLLYPAFGFFAWAIHFLVVYITTATGCALGLGATAAGVLLHAWMTYRRFRQVRDRRFLVNITVGHDAVAAIAILWQFFPIFLIPPCQ